MRRFHVKPGDISDASGVIRGTDARHIKHVLRLKPGAVITLFDGKGIQYEATITGVGHDREEASLNRRFKNVSESSLKLTVAQGFLKDRKMDVAVRQVTEIGVTRWIPYMAERSVPKPGGRRLQSRQQRWEKIAVEAVKQCRRGCIPAVGPTLSFDEMLEVGADADIKIIFWENENKPLTRSRLPDIAAVCPEAFIILGPEGGLTRREVDATVAGGFITAAMGPRILKADTAVIAACVMVQYLFGDMGLKKS